MQYVLFAENEKRKNRAKRPLSMSFDLHTQQFHNDFLFATVLLPSLRQGPINESLTHCKHNWSFFDQVHWTAHLANFYLEIVCVFPFTVKICKCRLKMYYIIRTFLIIIKNVQHNWFFSSLRVWPHPHLWPVARQVNWATNHLQVYCIHKHGMWLVPFKHLDQLGPVWGTVCVPLGGKVGRQIHTNNSWDFIRMSWGLYYMRYSWGKNLQRLVKNSWGLDTWFLVIVFRILSGALHQGTFGASKDQLGSVWGTVGACEEQLGVCLINSWELVRNSWALCREFLLCKVSVWHAINIETIGACE